MAHLHKLHAWDLGIGEALILQEVLRERIVEEELGGPVELVAGADISYSKDSPLAFAAIVVMALPELEVVEELGIATQVEFPYVPGLLSFREAPAILQVWSRLRSEPDALLVDGHGRAHPRRIGLACHLGLWVERPTVGCAKQLLCGEVGPLLDERGAWAPIVDGGETVGAALRTRAGVKPVYVSPGEGIDLSGALDLALACSAGLRIPEPVRRADILVDAMRRGERAPDFQLPRADVGLSLLE